MMSVTIGIDIGGTKIAGGLVDATAARSSAAPGANAGALQAGHRRPRSSRSSPTSSGLDAAQPGLGRHRRRRARRRRPRRRDAADRAVRSQPRLGGGAAGSRGERRLRAPRRRRERRQRRRVGRVPVRCRSRHARPRRRHGRHRHRRRHRAATTALVRGSYGMAAEFGHLVRVQDGRLCGCGKRGCWEQYASGNALLRKARDLAAERRGEASCCSRWATARRRESPASTSRRPRGGRPRRARGVPPHRHLARAPASPTSRRCSTLRCSSSAAASPRRASCSSHPPVAAFESGARRRRPPAARPDRRRRARQRRGPHRSRRPRARGHLSITRRITESARIGPSDPGVEAPRWAERMRTDARPYGSTPCLVTECMLDRSGCRQDAVGAHAQSWGVMRGVAAARAGRLGSGCRRVRARLLAAVHPAVRDHRVLPADARQRARSARWCARGRASRPPRPGRAT